MPGPHYYLMTALPTLGELGAASPISPRNFLESADDANGPTAVIRAILLGDDLLQRQAIISGEMPAADANPAVLTTAQVRDEETLDDFLTAATTDRQPVVADDLLWGAYFRWAMQIARQEKSEFLAEWVSFELALRNALAKERAETLGLESDDYLVEPELGHTGDDLSLVLAEWTGATDPLMGLKALDRARWDWLNRHGAYFSFADDEIAAYAARLMLLQRWDRISSAKTDKADVNRQ